MTAKFKQLKEELKSLEQGGSLSPPPRKNRSEGLFQAGLSSSPWVKHILLAGFLGTFLLYSGMTYLGAELSTGAIANPFSALIGAVTEPSEELLQKMGARMSEMGYGDLRREQLIELREQGVTATFTSRMRDLGYYDITLDQTVLLRQNGVSSTFAAMMKELGYALSIEELVNLRRHGVTAYYTSNLHDLGYNDISIDELIRLKDSGVTISEATQLIEERGEVPAVSELIRFHISNQ